MAKNKFVEDIERMRCEEGQIFGTAHGDGSGNQDSLRSKVELRLSDWNVAAEHKVLNVTSSPKGVELKMRYPRSS